MEKCDLIIVLGSQVTKNKGGYGLPPHTKTKAIAAVIAWQEEIAKKFIVSGGHNFGVRYNEKQILQKPDFSFEALVQGRKKKSEAEIIRDFMKANGVPEEAMFLEELSSYTEEQAKILRIILQRDTFSGTKKIGILTTLDHMQKALTAFTEAGLNNTQPLFAEEIVAARVAIVK